MSKPAIALVVPDLTVYSGVPAVALFLYRVIADAGRHTPELLSIATAARDRNSVQLSDPRTWGGARMTREETRGYEFSHFGAVFSEFELCRYWPRRVLSNELRRFDLVQIIGGAPPWGLVARDFDGPVALQVATLTAVERESALRGVSGARGVWQRSMSRLATAIEPKGLKLADAVFVENGWMYDRLVSEYGPEKIVFAAPGIDTDFFRPLEYHPAGPILSVGRFGDPRKNPALLFRAYHRLLQTRPDAPKLILAGETGPPEADLALAAELGIMDHVEIHCAVDLNRLREHYQEASMFVLSSNEEGLGLVILEAMACALPVVSTNCGGPETSVKEGETGFLTPVGDVDALANGMARVLADRASARRLGAAGRERAVAKFSLAATGRIYLEKYDELLAKGVS